MTLVKDMNYEEMLEHVRVFFFVGMRDDDFNYACELLDRWSEKGYENEIKRDLEEPLTSFAEEYKKKYHFKSLRISCKIMKDECEEEGKPVPWYWKLFL